MTYKRILIASLLLNCIFVGAFLYIGFVKIFNFNNDTLSQQKPVDYMCIQGWNNSLTKLGIEVDVCFFGNSITYRSDFRQYFPHSSICNLGYPGDNLQGMLLRIPAVKGVHPKILFIMGGINDLKAKQGQSLKANYTALVEALCDSLPDSKIYLQSILPINNEDFVLTWCDNNTIENANNIIKDIAETYGCGYIDLYTAYIKEGKMPKELTTDGVHLSPDAYEIWANNIRPYIQESIHF